MFRKLTQSIAEIASLQLKSAGGAAVAAAEGPIATQVPKAAAAAASKMRETTEQPIKKDPESFRAEKKTAAPKKSVSHPLFHPFCLIFKFSLIKKLMK